MLSFCDFTPQVTWIELWIELFACLLFFIFIFFLSVSATYISDATFLENWSLKEFKKQPEN